MILKNKLSEYKESEFKALISAIINCDGSEDEQDEYLENFILVTEYPDASDLIFYPESDAESTPDSILKKIKDWRLKNGKPLFMI